MVQVANRGRQRGLALVLVLWAGALLGVIAAAFAFSVRTEVRLATASAEAVQASALARSGIMRAIVGLSLTSEERWQGGGKPYVLELPTGEIRVAAFEEGGKVDVNAAPRALLEGLIRSVQVDEAASVTNVNALVDAVMDWRDSNDARRLNGAEDNDYRQAGLPYDAGDRPFLAVEELQRVMGMTPDLFRSLKPLVTVYGYSPRIDPMVATKEVLRAIPGMDDGLAEELISFREAALLTDAESGVAYASTRHRVVKHARSTMRRAARYLASTDANVYTIVAEGRLAGGATATRRATVRLSQSKKRPYQILDWDEFSQLSPLSESLTSGLDSLSDAPAAGS